VARIISDRRDEKKMKKSKMLSFSSKTNRKSSNKNECISTAD
jgi:hypothetical protein